MQPLQWLAAWLFLWCGPGWRLLVWAGFANFSFKEVPLIWLVTYQNEASLFLQDCARICTRSCRWSLNYRTAHCKVSERLVFLVHEVYSSGAAKLFEWLSMSELTLNDCMHIKGSVVARVQSYLFCLLLHAFVTVQQHPLVLTTWLLQAFYRSLMQLSMPSLDLKQCV